MCKAKKELLQKMDRIVLYLTEERTKEPCHSTRQFFWWNNYNDATELVRIAQMEVKSAVPDFRT